MAIGTRLCKGDEMLGASRILHANTCGAHPVVTLRFGNDVENVALGGYHQSFPRVGLGSDSACLASSDSNCFGQRRYGAVLVIWKFAWSCSGLHSQRRFELQQV